MENNKDGKVLQSKIKNLVICSTLNQITNYLIIKKYAPERVFNITLSDDKPNNQGNRNQFNINIKPEQWDKYLRDEVDKLKIKNSKDEIKKIEMKSISINQEDFYNLASLKVNIGKICKDINVKNEPIYWHITGGQRILSLAMSEIARDRDNEEERKKDREKDKILYLEGNTEKLIVVNNKFEFEKVEEYCDKDLTINQVLRLVGFQTGKENDTKSKKTFIKQGEFKIHKESSEYKFYNKLIQLIKENKEIRNKLLDNNILKTQNVSRRDDIKNYFKEQSNIEEYKKYEEDSSKIEENIKSNKDEDFFKEFEQNYPAGYIFEKIMAYSIYNVLQDKNYNIIEMHTSLKTSFLDNESCIDEIDILLLTNTGKLVNFECKSGDMSSNNAKSHNYTTYRLSGVFGMPILLSPLYKEEIDNMSTIKTKYPNSCSAIRAANRAELEACGIDDIESCLQKLNIIKK